MFDAPIIVNYTHQHVKSQEFNQGRGGYTSVWYNEGVDADDQLWCWDSTHRTDERGMTWMGSGENYRKLSKSQAPDAETDSGA